MRWEVELFVELKVPDVVALTARDTLCRRLGWQGKLVDLKRADYWRLTVEAPSAAEAEEFVQSLAERTALFVNPNKHRFSLRVSPPGEERRARQREGGLWEVQVLTGFEEDAMGELTLQALRARYGVGEQVQGIQRGTCWTLWLRASDEAEAQAWAEAIVVARGRKEGLLVNPHSQWWRWAR